MRRLGGLRATVAWALSLALPACSLTYSLSDLQGGTEGAAGASGASGAGGDGRVLPALPLPTGAVEITLTIDETADAHPISPYVYGTTRELGAGSCYTMTGDRTVRWSTYNWENNASNSGQEPPDNQNDGYLEDGDLPGDAIRKRVTAAQAAGAASWITLPMIGRVAKDKLGNGDVSAGNPAYLTTRFLELVFKKPTPILETPDTSDDKVYADEMIAFIERTFPNARTDPARTILYALDREPELWPASHPLLHPGKVTYTELWDRTFALSSAVKDVAPQAIIAGPTSYGWNAFEDLQGAPDAAPNGNFIDYYLRRASEAEKATGRRLIDVLSVQWYSEATGANGVRVIAQDSTEPTVVARLAAPRSLWDTSYLESSWITNDVGSGPIALLPRLAQKIAKSYPGTKLSLDEYWFGGGDDISGGLAEADTLGILGREGAFAARVGPLSGTPAAFIDGAIAMYRCWGDGKKETFGDTSVRAVSSDVARVTVYASTFTKDPSKLGVMAINKATTPIVVELVRPRATGASAAVLAARMQAGAPSPTVQGEWRAAAGTPLRFELPPRSATAFSIKP